MWTSIDWFSTNTKIDNNCQIKPELLQFMYAALILKFMFI